MKKILFEYMTRYTKLSHEEQQAIVDSILIAEFKKGTVLLRQGEIPAECYFVLEGCVRKHSVDETGKETTSGFYTEGQAVAMYNLRQPMKPSAHTLSCLEDCVLVVGALEAEQEMLQQHSQLETMIRMMVEESLGEMQDEWASFIASTPEERYKTVLEKRPQLVNRVPQHQLASYLGITPESLSRIKKRIGLDSL